MAAVCIAAVPLPGFPPSAPAQGNQNQPPLNFTVVPITITGVTVQNGQLFANGLIGSNPFQVPLTVGAEQSNGPCPILNLSLAPIDLNLLGLRVQTSAICLDVTAIPGGGLLGDLLCGVANLLSDGLPLADVLGILEAQGNLTQFLNGLTAILDNALDQIGSNGALVGATCSVLNLALGPLDLNLLGLRVELDNCANGPVTVDVTAIQGGGLLGDLLCALGGRPLTNPLATPVQRLLFSISQLLGQLLS
jgi:hypothetical protein